MAQVVVISSFNKQTGKTLLTAHFGVMLAKSYRTTVLDSCGTDSVLSVFTAKRYALDLSSSYGFSIANYQTLTSEKLQSLQSENDVILLDSPDPKYWAEADILITPVFGQVGMESMTDKNGVYASLVWQAKKQRASGGKNAFRWIVVPNGSFDGQILENLRQSGRFFGFSVAPMLDFRSEYDHGLKTGITVWDKDLPALKKMFSLEDLYARRNLKKIAEFIWQNG